LNQKYATFASEQNNGVKTIVLLQQNDINF